MRPREIRKAGRRSRLTLKEPDQRLQMIGDGDRFPAVPHYGMPPVKIRLNHGGERTGGFGTQGFKEQVKVTSHRFPSSDAVLRQQIRNGLLHRAGDGWLDWGVCVHCDA